MRFPEYLAGARAAFGDAAARTAAYLPNVIGALALVAIGWVLARLAGYWVARLVRGLDRLATRWRVDGALQRIGLYRPVSDTLGRLVFWVVLLFFVTAATEALGLPALTAWLTGVAYFLPRVVAAALVLLAGLLAANVTRDVLASAATSAGLAYGPALGQIARAVVLLVTALIAINELGVDVTVITVTLAVVLAALLGAGALAFGLGARTAVSNIIGSHYLRQILRIGQMVRLDGVEGRIVAITATSVIIDGADGRIIVPAKRFSEATSVLLEAGRPA